MYREGALCFTFSGVPSSLSRLCSPGEKEGKKTQGRKSKNETQASNCQICDNVKFRHYYPGYAGNHFTRLRRHLGLKSDIIFKPLTSRFAKAIALSLNCPCVKRNPELERLPLSWVSSGAASHHPRHHFQGTRVAQPAPHSGPWLLQQLKLVLLPPAHSTAAASMKFLSSEVPSHTPALRSRILHGLVFSPAQPGIPSSCTGICHLAAARSSAS